MKISRFPKIKSPRQSMLNSTVKLKIRFLQAQSENVKNHSFFSYPYIAIL